VTVADSVAEVVDKQAFSVQEIMSGDSQVQILQPSAAAKDSPTLYVLSFNRQVPGISVGET
jgi:hypothetical protein